MGLENNWCIQLLKIFLKHLGGSKKSQEVSQLPFSSPPSWRLRLRELSGLFYFPFVKVVLQSVHYVAIANMLTGLLAPDVVIIQPPKHNFVFIRVDSKTICSQEIPYAVYELTPASPASFRCRWWKTLIMSNVIPHRRH